MNDTADRILAMERAAMDRWGRGDPDGFLEISDPDVVYFDTEVYRLTAAGWRIIHTHWALTNAHPAGA